MARIAAATSGDVALELAELGVGDVLGPPAPPVDAEASPSGPAARAELVGDVAATYSDEPLDALSAALDQLLADPVVVAVAPVAAARVVVAAPRVPSVEAAERSAVASPRGPSALSSSRCRRPPLAA